jgi:hypothetical protein
MEDAGGLEESVMNERGIDILPLITVESPEDALCGDTLIELVAMARGASGSTDASLTDRTNFCGDTPVYEPRTIV